LSIVFVSLHLAGGWAAFGSSLGILSLTAICSVALGLLLSTVVGSSEAAMALTPIALIPQVVLGGLMVPVTTNKLLELPMLLVPSRWGFEGAIRPERIAVQHLEGWRIALPGAPDSPPDFVINESFECALAQMQSTDLDGAWGFGQNVLQPPSVLLAMTAAILAVVMYLLSKRV
jgi:ABC-type transport system involved in multi-copper enzyme maturation permease subunit